MLIITTRAFKGEVDSRSTADAAETPVLVVLPDSGLSKPAIERLTQLFIVINYVGTMPTAQKILDDALEIGRRVELNAAPAIYIDEPYDEHSLIADIAAVGDYECSIRLSEDNRVVRATLGSMIASSPLLPEFFSFLRGRTISDDQLADLLKTVFQRGEA